MPSFLGLQKFFGSAVSSAAGFAAGAATAPVLHPEIHELENLAWEKYKSRRIDPGTAAAIVAEAVDNQPWGEKEAGYSGIDSGRFDLLLGEALNAPGIGELFQLWRRGLIDNAGFAHGLRKAKLEPRWDGPLEALHDVLLSSEELAMMQQQGFVSDARANSEGALQGVTPERQQLRFEASGLPPGVETGLEMLRRGIVDEATFAQIVREGHTKTKYTGQLTALRDRVLSAATYATLALKGWITPTEMHAGGALTGYAPEQMDLLFKEHGRPATTHQVWIGLQRGGKYIGASLSERETFDRAIIQSDIRPEWADLLWAQRYTYPSVLALRPLTQSGAITAAQAETILGYEGWEPTLAKQVAEFWATPATGGTDALTKKAQVQLWTATHKAYVNADMTAAQAHGELAALGADAAEQDAVIALWNREREVIRLTLTPAQIRKAFSDAIFTRDEAIARLERLGMDAADAGTLLDE